jgi:putative membrane-bound dehydrogenase-like protein
MQKRILTTLLSIIVLAGCQKNQEKITSSLEDRDAFYATLTPEQRRLPENAIAGLEVAEGLEISLFASEAMIGNPTNIDIDSKGRVWMCEAFNYRPDLNPDNPRKEEGDRILILEDTNGDGKADKSTVFYQGNDINAALGITVLGNKVIVSCSPNVFIFTDLDGDDVPDKKEVLFTGIKGVQHDHGMHSFTFGPDGKLYFNFGNDGKQLGDKDGNIIIDKAGNKITDHGNPYRQGMVFRSNLDGSEVEVLGHNFRNNYEVAVDSYGTLWQSDNDDDGNKAVRINYVMEYGNYGYTNEMTGAGWRSHRVNVEEEIFLKHWHQNDPGSIPNLLNTGAGSPTGILVYEGDLLPKVFHNQMIHGDAGPNIVRAYPVQNDGAGYKAEIVKILEGTRDQWFRPSDVAVAPDGSLFVADWYDPGVGGHQMGDMNRGRIYRIAPDASKYKVTKVDLSNTEGAIEALKNPNLAIRHLAWTTLHEMGDKAEPALGELWKNGSSRYRARALWLLGKIEGKHEKYINEALNDKDENIRITGLRLARQQSSDILPYAQKLVNDANPQVRREVAIAIRHHQSPEAAELWASLAAQYDGKDRWYLEALGISADKQWDRFFAAYKDKVGDPLAHPGGKDVVWRARTGSTLPLLAGLIKDQATSDKERQKYFRAFDFIDDPAKEKTILALLKEQVPNKDQIIYLSLSILNPDIIKKDPQLQKILNQTLERTKGSKAFLELLARYKLKNYNNVLLELALENSENADGVDAARLLLSLEGAPLLKTIILSEDVLRSSEALTVISKVDNSASLDLIQELVLNNMIDFEKRKEAVYALGTGWGGEERLLNIVKEGRLQKELEELALKRMQTAMRRDVRSAAFKLKDAGTTADGKNLASIDDLAKRKGVTINGAKIFKMYCASCHKDGTQGDDFGPSLSQIGNKLSKEAIYTAIIQPDAGISFGYEGFMFKLKDGSQTAGIIASETAEMLELKSPGGITTKISKDNIDSREQMDGSMMPALHQSMTEQELIDLVEYLTTLRPLSK